MTDTEIRTKTEPDGIWFYGNVKNSTQSTETETEAKTEADTIEFCTQFHQFLSGLSQCKHTISSRILNKQKNFTWFPCYDVHEVVRRVGDVECVVEPSRHKVALLSVAICREDLHEEGSTCRSQLYSKQNSNALTEKTKKLSESKKIVFF